MISLSDTSVRRNVQRSLFASDPLPSSGKHEQSRSGGKIDADLAASDFEDAACNVKEWLKDRSVCKSSLGEAPQVAWRSMTKSTTANSDSDWGMPGVQSRSSTVITETSTWETPNWSGTFSTEGMSCRVSEPCMKEEASPTKFCELSILLPAERVITVHHDVDRTFAALKEFFSYHDATMLNECSHQLEAYMRWSEVSSFLVGARVYFCEADQSAVVLQPLCKGDIVNFHRMAARLSRFFSLDAGNGYESENSSVWSEDTCM